MRDRRAVVQKFSLQQAADQGAAAHIEQDMFAADLHGHVALLGHQLQQLGQRLAGHDKAHILVMLRLFAAQRQPKAIHRHHGQLAALQLKQAAGLHRFGIVGSNGVAGHIHHRRKGGHRHGKAGSLAHRRQLREFLGGHAQNSKLRHAAGDLHQAAVVRFHRHLVALDPPHDIGKHLGGDNDLARLLHPRLHTGGDAHFQVIAHQRDLPHRGPHQDPFQGQQGTFGAYRQHRGVDALAEQLCIAGKFHHLGSPFRIRRRFPHPVRPCRAQPEKKSPFSVNNNYINQK